jgi:endogenous inhibitor of DNA gyrase (YacG/DUF329 family)
MKSELKCPSCAKNVSSSQLLWTWSLYPSFPCPHCRAKLRIKGLSLFNPYMLMAAIFGMLIGLSTVAVFYSLNEISTTTKVIVMLPVIFAVIIGGSILIKWTLVSRLSPNTSLELAS